jgi:hypothetical protein
MCVGFCDYWLNLIYAKPDEPAEIRLRTLAAKLSEVRKYHKQYANLRPWLGRNSARETVGAGLQLSYEEQTMLIERLAGLEGIKARMIRDLSSWGRGATWTIATDNMRHALAGFCGIRRLEYHGMEMRMHLFDPNLGEFIGAIGELEKILAQLFGPSIYGKPVELCRMRVGGNGVSR